MDYCVCMDSDFGTDVLYVYFCVSVGIIILSRMAPLLSANYIS